MKGFSLLLCKNAKETRHSHPLDIKHKDSLFEPNYFFICNRLCDNKLLYIQRKPNIRGNNYFRNSIYLYEGFVKS